MGLSGRVFLQVIFLPKSPKNGCVPKQPACRLLGTCRAHARRSETQIGVWSAQNASKPSENIINTTPKYPQTYLETFFFGSFFTPYRPKMAKSPTLPLQAPRHLQASRRGIKDKIGVWRLQNASKPSQNIINTPPKYPQTHLEPFFFGSFFTPNPPKTAKSSSTPLRGY